MKSFVFLLVVSIVLFSGCVQEPEPQSCTEDLKICPGGVSLVRNPDDDCKFPVCPSGGGEPVSYDVVPDPMSGLMTLTDASKQKLFDKIVAEGDSALAGLASLSSLEYLDLSYFGVSDISYLSQFGGLKEINLSYTGVSDVLPLVGISSLESVNVSYSGVSDVSPLAGLPNLKKLWAVSCGISDVSSLEAMTGLNQLNLKYNSVSGEDCDVLKAALSSTDVYC